MDGEGRPRSRAARRLRSLSRIALIFLALTGIAWVTGCMERLFYYPEAGPTPAPAEHPGAESVWFESADGTRLHGWFIPARSGDGAPSVLHVHGNAGNITSHIWFTEYLPGAGFNLFVFDYRGYGQSAGRARRRDDLIADTSAALDALLARPEVDPDRVGMYAQSLGGAIGLNVMAERPEIRAAIVESAFTSWRDMAASAVARSGDPGPIARLAAAVLIRDHRRPDDAIARIDRPILLFHGDHDGLVPVEHGRRLAKACPTCRFVELPGGDHNSLRATNPEIEGQVIEFLTGHLLPGGNAP